MRSVLEQAQSAKKAWRIVRQANTATKNTFLAELSRLLLEQESTVLAANQKDLTENTQLSSAMRRRLELTQKAIQSIAASVRIIAELPDPVGQIVSSHVRTDGLEIERVRTPIGVIAAIFESRPNIVVDIAALCIKSGNVAIVRGGKEAIHSNAALVDIIQQALIASGLPEDALQRLEDRRHEAVAELVRLDSFIDLAIPRGGETLIKNVLDNARVPVIQHMRGLCHAYIDVAADPAKAVAIAVNAKTSNPSTCNSIETILVHSECADVIMPQLIEALHERGVEIRGCPRTCAISPLCIPAVEADWSTEYLDLIVSIKIADSTEDAIQHIEQYSSGLTDSIITKDPATAQVFLNCVDSACVLVNASNRLVDGAQLGLGGEIGISTARIHMRGPMGLEDLTVPAYRVRGDGHLRT